MKIPKHLMMTKLMTVGLRLAPTRTPAEAGLDYEDVEFTASDGLDLKGWFVPAGPEQGPVVFFVHGWMWNRLGNVAGRVPFVDKDVDFLPTVKALHDAGFHVLLFDLANHGVSASRFPITYGQWEARDMIGAVAYLHTGTTSTPSGSGRSPRRWVATPRCMPRRTASPSRQSCVSSPTGRATSRPGSPPTNSARSDHPW